MRLLHTEELTFKEFFDAQRPAYCILSHRRGPGEVNHQAMRNGTADEASEGYCKIVGCCKVARDIGFDWIWIATCCIDKSSSAELSEAKNSMFDWYSKADICIAYLSDVKSQSPLYGAVNDGDLGLFGNEFRGSSRFTRGWTLQELLAPANLKFYNSTCTFIETKSDLHQMISDTTGIESDYIMGKRSIYEACVAERMSWASNRITTRSSHTPFWESSMSTYHSFIEKARMPFSVFNWQSWRNQTMKLFLLGFHDHR